jgi:hypothetical protein
VGGSTSLPSEVSFPLLLDDVGGFKLGLRRRLQIVGELSGLLVIEKCRNGFCANPCNFQATSAFGGVAGFETPVPSRSAAA